MKNDKGFAVSLLYMILTAVVILAVVFVIIYMVRTEVLDLTGIAIIEMINL